MADACERFGKVGVSVRLGFGLPSYQAVVLRSPDTLLDFPFKGCAGGALPGGPKLPWRGGLSNPSGRARRRLQNVKRNPNLARPCDLAAPGARPCSTPTLGRHSMPRQPPTSGRCTNP